MRSCPRLVVPAVAVLTLLASGLVVWGVRVAEPPPVAAVPRGDVARIELTLLDTSDLDRSEERWVPTAADRGGASEIWTRATEVRVGGATTFDVGGVRRLEVELLEDGPKASRLRLQLFRDRSRAVDTTVRLRKGRFFTLTGFDDERALLLAVGPPPDPRG